MEAALSRHTALLHACLWRSAYPRFTIGLVAAPSTLLGVWRTQLTPLVEALGQALGGARLIDSLALASWDT